MVFSFREIVGRYFVEHMPNVYIPHATNISFFYCLQLDTMLCAMSGLRIVS